MRKGRLRRVKGLDDGQVSMLLTIINYPELFPEEVERLKNTFPRSYVKWKNRLRNEAMKRGFYKVKERLVVK